MDPKATSKDSGTIIAQLQRENEALRRELDALRAMSAQDPLTGLKNRRYFDERLASELDRAVRRRESLSLLVIDLDGFKALNDTQGHLAGDECLRRVARLLEVAVREHDIVCRIGGDEFAVILPGADEEGARYVAKRIRDRVAGARRRQGLEVGLSLGTASWDAGYDDLPAFVAAADAAMYQDKQRRRARAPEPRRQRFITRPLAFGMG